VRIVSVLVFPPCRATEKRNLAQGRLAYQRSQISALQPRAKTTFAAEDEGQRDGGMCATAAAWPLQPRPAGRWVPIWPSVAAVPSNEFEVMPNMADRCSSGPSISGCTQESKIHIAPPSHLGGNRRGRHIWTLQRPN